MSRHQQKNHSHLQLGNKSPLETCNPTTVGPGYLNLAEA